MGFNGNRQHSSFPPHYSHLYFCDARQNVHQLRPNRRGVSMQPANNYTGFTRRLPPLSAYEHRFPRFARSSTPVLTPRSRTAENNEDSDHRLILTQKHLEAEQAKRMNVEKQIAVLTESYKTRIIGLESQLKECNNNSSNIEEPKNKLTISQKEYCDNLQQNDQELDHFGKRLGNVRKNCVNINQLSQISNLENDKKKLEVENEYLKQKCQDLIAGIDFCRVKPESVSSRSEQKEAELQKLRMQIDGLQKCNDTFSSHIDKLEAEKNDHKWQKEKENEYIKTELERYKIELESAKSQNEQLKAVNDGLQESNQKLMEIKKENSQLNDDLNRLRADLDANADALEMKNKEIERLMNSIAQNSEQSCPRVELEACQTELEKCKADLEKAQDDRDRFKEQHKISNENLEITEQKLLKAGTRMQAQECEQHDDQIKELMRKLSKFYLFINTLFSHHRIEKLL
ncbi:hypothetical protein Ddc_12270 [Ditylenchus destructor]|nr:hypothetical protein Ddc_12270 [Ditylenchus destructor]